MRAALELLVLLGRWTALGLAYLVCYGRLWLACSLALRRLSWAAWERDPVEVMRDGAAELVRRAFSTAEDVVEVRARTLQRIEDAQQQLAEAHQRAQGGGARP